MALFHFLLLHVVVLLVLGAPAEMDCPAYDYAAAAGAHDSSIKQPLAGLTRSVVRPSSYALLTPESRVYGGAPPGWEGDRIFAAAVVTPALGAHFSMYLVDAAVGARMSNAVTYDGAPPRLERLLYVLSGSVTVSNASSREEEILAPGGFLYVASGDSAISAQVGSIGARFVLIDRQRTVPESAKSVVGAECDIEEEVPFGEVFKLRRLLDKNDKTLDFNIHIMDFEPGEYLNVKEVHYNQHGLLMLEGHGIYMLADNYYPVSTGDVVYMAPFVPQWYAALGKTRSRYFLYKDTNTNPLSHH